MGFHPEMREAMAAFRYLSQKSQWQWPADEAVRAGMFGSHVRDLIR